MHSAAHEISVLYYLYLRARICTALEYCAKQRYSVTCTLVAFGVVEIGVVGKPHR